MAGVPKVSVIIAAFNAEGHIERAVASALVQQGVEVEVLVGDDASVDRTAEVASRLGSERVRVVRLARNGGPSVARNAAIAQAEGDWLAVLDADDAMAPGRLAALAQAAEAKGADLIADNMTVRSGASTRLFIEERLDGGLERIGLAEYARHNRLFAKGRGYGYLKPLFRRSFLQRHGLAYDPQLRVGEDFQLVAEMLARGAIYLRQRSAGYTYVVREGSISHRLSVPAARAMVAADRRFLVAHGEALAAETRRSMQGHLRSLQDGAAFLDLMDRLKVRDLRGAAALALSRPLALRHVHMPLGVRLRRLVLRARGAGHPRAP